MEFGGASTPEEILSLAPQERDGLAFGVIEMEPGGVVRQYNDTEAALSGLTADDVVGRDFFVAVAPCTNNFLVRERFVSEPELDATIDYVFSYRMRPTPVRLRLFRRPTGPWLLLVRRSDPA